MIVSLVVNRTINLATLRSRDILSGGLPPGSLAPVLVHGLRRSLLSFDERRTNSLRFLQTY